MRDAASAELRELIPRAKREGMTVAEITRLSGMTRKAVDDVLARYG